MISTDTPTDQGNRAMITMNVPEIVLMIGIAFLTGFAACAIAAAWS